MVYHCLFFCNSWQNHNYAVDPASLPGGVEVTHVNLNDGSCAGLSFPEMNVMSLQYHPEASPGPHDSDNGNCPLYSSHLVKDTYASVVLKNQKINVIIFLLMNAAFREFIELMKRSKQSS